MKNIQFFTRSFLIRNQPMEAQVHVPQWRTIRAGTVKIPTVGEQTAHLLHVLAERDQRGHELFAVQHAVLLELAPIDQALHKAAHVVADRQLVDAFGENDACDGGVVQVVLIGAQLGVEAGCLLQLAHGRNVQLEWEEEWF